ncbi:MAG: hypothetical protein IPH49_14735 [Ignavibacteria bacterium]|nr:hypothetical protein [Ignavibacteria bacterium]
MVIRDLSDLDALRENKTRLETAFTFALIVAERSRLLPTVLQCDSLIHRLMSATRTDTAYQ